MNNKNELTILTPTYNRAYILPQLYNSLVQQSSLNFKWIIVDDGSEDDTEQIVNSWIEENIFEIVYLKKGNGGKHTALNYGISYITDGFVFVVDSDDYLVKDAVKTILKWIEENKENKDLAGFAGLRGRYVEKELTKLGQFPSGYDYVDATNLDRKPYKLLGDKAEIYRVSFFKKYPFPEYEGEKFLPEDVVYNRIALDGYKLRWYSNILIVCEYLPDGLTAAVSQKHFEKNINGYCESYYLNWIGLRFPFNYSSAVEFHKKMRLAGKNSQDERAILKIGRFKYYTISLAALIKKFIKNRV